MNINKLNVAITEIANLPKSDKVNIKGKFYTQVATRVEIFRKAYGDSAKITTKVILHDLERVVVKAFLMKAYGMLLVATMQKNFVERAW